MKELRYFITIFALLLCPLASFACWDDDDDYLYDDSIWLDEVICTPDWDDDDDSDFDDGWWRSDDSDGNYDDENQDYGWDDGEDEDRSTSIGYSDDFYNDKNKKHEHRADELCIDDKQWFKLPDSFPKQNYKANCVPTVLEYVSNFLDNRMNSSEYVPFRDSFEFIYNMFLADGNLDITTDGVDLMLLERMLEECGFDYLKINVDDVNSYISDGDPVIGTVHNEWGLHEVFITSSYSDGNFGGYDPGTGQFEYFGRESLIYIYVIYKK